MNAEPQRLADPPPAQPGPESLIGGMLTTARGRPLPIKQLQTTRELLLLLKWHNGYENKS